MQWCRRPYDQHWFHRILARGMAFVSSNLNLKARFPKYTLRAKVTSIVLFLWFTRPLCHPTVIPAMPWRGFIINSLYKWNRPGSCCPSSNEGLVYLLNQLPNVLFWHLIQRMKLFWKFYSEIVSNCPVTQSLRIQAFCTCFFLKYALI